MIQDDFIFRLFFGSLAAMALSIVFFAVCIFLAGKIISAKENKPGNAVKVALIAFLIGIAVKMLSFIDAIFLVALQFFGALFAIKYFYKNNYSNAAILLAIATIIFIILELLTAPWIIGA
jgi:hypothetical protein